MKYTNLTAGDKEILLSLADSKGRVAIRSTTKGEVFIEGFKAMNERMGDAIRATLKGSTPEDADASLTLNGGRLAIAAAVGGVVGLYDIA